MQTEFYNFIFCILSVNICNVHLQRFLTLKLFAAIFAGIATICCTSVTLWLQIFAVYIFNLYTFFIYVNTKH